MGGELLLPDRVRFCVASIQKHLEASGGIWKHPDAPVDAGRRVSIGYSVRGECAGTSYVQSSRVQGLGFRV
jgi:hypothetical protein